MIFDIARANELLNLCGTRNTPRDEFNKEVLFKELYCIHWHSDYNAPNDDIDEEVCDFINFVQFEMSDLNFALIEEKDDWVGPCIMLYVSLRCDPSYDQHMEVPYIDNSTEWCNSMEQAWEYSGEKDINTLRKEFEAQGAVWDEELLSYFVE
jgi:hypothetical protein